MNDFSHNHDLNRSEAFDQQSLHSNEIIDGTHSATSHQIDTGAFHVHDNAASNSIDIFQYTDPLKHVNQFQMHPLHFVKPHYVDGYMRQDGTYVEGYWRDGDGNVQVDRTVEMGGGYARSNPDDIISNNLNQKF
ncbi:hypothetical protein [Bacillus wiedmannii]|uniref:Uncharacterized protein n=1 Tax=Bacillus wiedmannii TaxID=1890302 RepID=A0ABD6TQ99_9BACI|nr:hypothetical protein [Bacillus wiedmannii]PEO54352.1 hypothetical protein CN560_26605 [Bacillus wiedmannii]PGA30228.1 hypothetical protein COL74_26275 [Bacillus wiedmannii]PGC71487.1 hypothetical protein COM25_27485 [Bacillus wiedmannii]PHB90162.1 hypothetical protein COE96_27695 [Bacillus wiedmannii]PHF19752.1 hypothetical protein COF84_12355 [Bacillus wiedmannii]